MATTLIKPEFTTPTPAAKPAARPWYRTTWFLALASSLALWLPLSPWNVSALAWIAPLGWLLLIREEKLPGKWPYAVLYLAGLVHWLLVMEGIRRAYWALYFGWFALAAYLAVYLLLFVGLSRVAVHRLKVPLCLAAPTIWVALELVRGYAVTGFSMGLLGHTQADLAPLIQISDLGGAYAVSFVVMSVAACVAQVYPWWFGRWQRWPAFALAAVLVAVFSYGYARLSAVDAAQQHDAEPLRVTLLQNSVDTIFGVPMERHAETYRLYQTQAEDAAKAMPNTQLMVWPESVFTSLHPDVVIEPDAAPPADSNWPPEEFARFMVAKQEEFAAHAQNATQRIHRRGGSDSQIPQIVGTLTYHFHADRIEQYNSALLLSPQGEVLGRYGKMHLVMFGEYIPLGETFPWIYQWTPMGGGLSRGQEAAVFAVAGRKLAPSICFESTVPHLIRRQVRELEADGTTPDMLVSVTNDGWFWGSGVLDLHYKCAIFRAVEHRKPMLVAANTGFSTAVDSAGRVLAVGPRREVQTLQVTVPVSGLASFYTRWGDVFATACLAFAAVCAGVGMRRTSN